MGNSWNAIRPARAVSLMTGVVGLAMLVGGCNLGVAPVAHAAASRVVGLADVDGDGAVDLVAAGTGGEAVLLNDGTGGFSGGPVVTTSDVRSLALGDVDGDGTIDRVETDRSVSTPIVTLSRGDGDGGFSSPAPVPGLASGFTAYSDAVLIDLDSDGDLDMLTAETAWIMPWMNDGLGTFTAGPPSMNIEGPYLCGSAGSGHSAVLDIDLEPFDVEGDGDLDLAWTGVCGLSRVVGRTYNSGQGTFAGGETSIGGPTDWFSVGTADINEDGFDDHVFARSEEAAVEVRITRNPPVQPGPLPPATVLTVSIPWAVSAGAVGDVDGDGHADLLLAKSGTGIVQVLYGDGAGTFPERHNLYTGRTTVDTVVVDDVDANGRLDVVVGTDNSAGDGAEPSVSVFLNTLNGRQH